MRTGVSPKRIVTVNFLLRRHVRHQHPSISLRYISWCCRRLIQSFAPCQLTKLACSSDMYRSLVHDSLKDQHQYNPYFFLRKEVIQPHLPIRLPCYDFTPVTRPAFGTFLPSCCTWTTTPGRIFNSVIGFANNQCGSCPPRRVRTATSGISDSHGVTGGVYKTRERIHRSILICDY